MRQSRKVKKSLFYSIVDGSFWSVMFGMGERYLSAFAVFLKATDMIITESFSNLNFLLHYPMKFKWVFRGKKR
ncbi:hypothetical protein GF361_05245 [Candidatus Woesearchaeota archaeon]|nr:hypothetical protein [Candidatus Woesearchaeota archaeon]